MQYRSWLVVLAVLSASAITCPADVRQATLDHWLDQTRHLESRGDPRSVGDRGRSRGAYQIQRGPWRAYGGRGPWHVYAHREPEARKVAARILRACERACVRDKKAVNFKNVRWYYKHGGY